MKIHSILVVGFVFLVMNMRPALIGNTFNELFLLFPMVGLVALDVFSGHKIVVSKSKIVLFIITLMFALFIFSQIAILDPDNIYFGWVLIITIPAVVIGCTLLIRNSDTELVLKTIVVVVALLSISQLITYLLILLGLQDVILLKMLFPTKEYAVLPLKLYFPFTFTYHFVYIFGTQMERSVGLFREPGLYQMFIVISYFALEFINIRYKHCLRVLFLLSLLMTFSTAGYTIFLGCLAFKTVFALRGRIFQRFFLLVALIPLFGLLLTFPFLGLFDKMARNIIRMSGIVYSWELLMKHPLWGCGLTSTHQSVLGVNLISSLHALGIVGLFLYLGSVTYALRKHYTIKTFTLLLPVIGTLLIAQPMYEKGFTFLMLFLSTRNLKPLEEEYRSKRRLSQPGLA